MPGSTSALDHSALKAMLALGFVDVKVTPVSGRLDHAIIAVSSLEAAITDYERLGFRAMPEVVHPSGATANRIMMLGHSFIELLEIRDASKLTPTTPTQFSFGDHHRKFLRNNEGVAIFAIDSYDVSGSLARCAERGVEAYPPFHFRREAKMANGDMREVEFSLGFIVNESLGDVGMLLFQQHKPQFFWQREYMSHRNGAMNLEQAYIVTSDFAELYRVFEALYGESFVEAGPDSLIAHAPNGRWTALTNERFVERFGKEAIPVAKSAAGPYYGAFSVRVKSVENLRSLLVRGHVPFNHSRGSNRIVVGPEIAHGIFLEFIEIPY